MPNGLEGTAGNSPVTTDPPFAEPVSANPGPRLQPPLEPGDLGALGQYRVVEVLGKGGMGVIFLGVDTQIRRKVALKTMLPKFASSRAARERFLKEARAAGAIHHDNVVVIYQVGEAGGTPFIAMEHLAGESLEVHLRKHPSPPLPQVVKILREVAAGLAAAHQSGVIHRDVKPDNIWLEAPTGRVKLLDFGLARVPDLNGGQSGTVGLIGTPAYMSPEQARGTGVDHRSDLFSLGSVAYELVVGRPPFTGANMFDVLAGVMSRNPVPPRQVKPFVPATLDTLILRLLAKEPDVRPQSAAEVEAELALVQAHLSPAAGGEPAVVYVTVPVNVVQERPAGPDSPADAGRLVVTPAPRPAGSTVPPAAVTPAPAGPVDLPPPPPEPDPAPKVGGGSTWSGLATAAAEHPPWENPPPAPPTARWKLYAAVVLAGMTLVGLAAAAVLRLTGGEAPVAQTTTPATQPPPTRPTARAPRYPLLDPAFAEKVKALPAPEQLKAVTEELRRRNPKFTHALEPAPNDSKLSRVALNTDFVVDITPLRALPNLTHVRLYGGKSGQGMLADLSPLAGLPLTHLTVNNTPVSDLTPLVGMPLELLDLRDTNVESLTPLKGMTSLRSLTLAGCRWASNLDPLRGLPLKSLDVSNTLVERFEPVGGCPLEVVRCGPKAADLTPLANCPLTDVVVDPPPDFASPLRATPVKTVNRMAADAYWQRADARRDAAPVTPFAVWNTAGRPAMALAWVPGTDLLAVATPDAVSGRTVGVGLTPWKCPRLDDSTSDGRWAAASGDRLAVAFRGRIRFLDPKTGAEKGDPIDPGRNIDAHAASRDGRVVAVAHFAGDDPRFTLFPADGSGAPTEFKDVPRFTKAFALSADGSLAAAGGWHSFKVWDLATRKETLARTPDDTVTAVQFAPVGRRVLALTTQGDLFVLDPDRADAEKLREPIYRLSGHGLTAACFTPDAAGLVVTWAEGWAGYYPLDRPGPAVEFPLPAEPVRCLTFSPDGKTLVTGHEQHVRLWDWAAIRTPTASTPTAPPQGFEKLFTGTDLKGWTARDWEPRGSWSVQNGHLVGASTHADKFAWLETEREFGDFELRLEYRWQTVGGDSGIAIRAKKFAGWPPYDGLELNLADDTNAEDLHGRPPADWDRTGSLSGFAKPTGSAPKRIGEWNSVKITARGRSLTMEQNGKVIQSADLAKLEAAVKEKDRDHARGLKQARGVIALQTFRGRIEFRNVFVKELPAESPAK